MISKVSLEEEILDIREGVWGSVSEARQCSPRLP